MSDREKILGIAVGGLLALFAVFGIYRMVNSGFESKHEEIVDLDSKLKVEKGINLAAMRDRAEVAEFQRRSLPGNAEAAHLEFVHWLELQVKEVGLTKESVNFDAIPRTKEKFKELSYTVMGLGDIRQVSELLYRIHSADNLHRVRTLDLVKQKEANQLKINMRVDALSMADMEGTPKVPVGEVDKTKLAMSLDEYRDILSARNLFSPANQAPRFARLRTQEVEIGKRLSYKVSAEDPEEHDLVFQIGEDAPSSMDISKSGTLTWRPKEEGEYEFKVYVADKGIPSKEDVATLKVRVIPEREPEPEEKEEEFDDATLAILTAIVQGARDPMPQMCMYLRSKDESKYLQQGDRIRIGKWKGEVVEVDPDRNLVRLSNDEGEFELRLGEALADARLVEPL